MNQNTLDLTISDADLQDSGIRRSVDLTRPNEQVWTITGRVSGVNSSLSSMFCTTSLRVNYPLLPSCNLTFDKIELLKNEKTTARLNCSGGGPVSSAIIKTYRGNQLLAAELKSERNLTTSLGSTDLSGETSKMFSFEHTRTEVVLGETVVVEVKGPGGMRPFSAALGNVCPYNETSFSRVEIPSKTVFRWYSFDPENYVNKRGDWICRNCVGGSITLNNIAFSQGSYQYTLSGQIATNETPPRTKPDNLYMWARSASDYDWIDNNWTEDKNTCILADGSWGGCWMGGAGAETCNPDNFCLMSVEYSGSGYPDKSFKVGGQFFWIEVGRADGSDGGKYDPNCRLKVVKTREGGCFAPNTRLQMADG
ncbi:hypothetical protein EBR03_09475, partial [bacterium]|nr:hypothetical protein [bacterium]